MSPIVSANFDTLCQFLKFSEFHFLNFNPTVIGQRVLLKFCERVRCKYLTSVILSVPISEERFRD